MVPIPKVHDLSVLNERLLARCLEAARRAGGRGAGGGAARRPRRPARSAGGSLRGLRACAGPDLVHGPGALPAGGLLGAGGARPQEGHGEGLCRPGRDRARRRDRRPPSALLCPRRRRLRPVALSVAAGEEAGRPGPGGAAAGMEARSGPSTRCAASSRRASGRAASANTSRCCACTKTSRNRRCGRGTLRRRADDDQQALRIVLEPGLHMDAVGPEVDIVPGRQIPLQPVRVLVRPNLGEPRHGRGRQAAGVRPGQGRQRLGEVARGDALECPGRYPDKLLRTLQRRVACSGCERFHQAPGRYRSRPLDTGWLDRQGDGAAGVPGRRHRAPCVGRLGPVRRRHSGQSVRARDGEVRDRAGLALCAGRTAVEGRQCAGGPVPVRRTGKGTRSTTRGRENQHPDAERLSSRKRFGPNPRISIRARGV